ncbi:MAG: hypothetical protein CMQ24_00585 [Gammaproteobacteria bacterium]|nr:hypothetical protein [Gammaproteobacteria bacterium]
MPTLKPATVEVYDNWSGPVTKARNELTGQAWFGGDWWINQSFGSSGFGFQLSKTHWFNHRSRGIHFEFWIDSAEVAAGTFPIVLHFEPETPDRDGLGRRFAGAFADRQAEFADYRINHKAVCDKMVKEIKLTKAGLPKSVVAEFTRLATLGDLIDGIL